MSDEETHDTLDESQYLIGIAKALSDGLPVDWEESDADDPEMRRMKARLRFLQSIAEAHRRMLQADSGHDDVAAG